MSRSEIMGSYRSHSFNLHIDPPLQKDSKVVFEISPIPLLFSGLNISVIISNTSIFSLPDKNLPFNSAQILAHFDTGASITSIDLELAKQLNLIPTGKSSSNTAAGLRSATNFVIDLSFPGTDLRPFINLQISSCDLSHPSKSIPFKLLLGRDIMSRWNIIWDGPSSTVIISD